MKRMKRNKKNNNKYKFMIQNKQKTNKNPLCCHFRSFSAQFHFVLTVFFSPFSFQMCITAANRLLLDWQLIVVAQFFSYHWKNVSHRTFLKFTLIVLITTRGYFSRPVSAAWFNFTTAGRKQRNPQWIKSILSFGTGRINTRHQCFQIWAFQ